MTQPKHHDTYESKAKAPSAEVCERCGAVSHAGRWTWGEPPLTDVRTALCPACRRIRDHYPAGTIHLPESFLEDREEIVGMIHNAEEAEKQEHPLERLMDLRDAPEGGMVVTTTGIHLARAITHKLERRFRKQARIRYPAEENILLVDWEA